MAYPRQTPLLEKGTKFGRLTVVADHLWPVSSTRIPVRCDCGTEKTVALNNLKANTRSCGCVGRERAVAWGQARAVHGHARQGNASPTYNVWCSMIKRCYSPKTSGYYNYGGRGIEVCDRWRHSFKDFLKDMGERPEGRTLDRVDVQGNYEPGNCRWATPAQQQANTRRALGIPGNATVKQLLDRAGVPKAQTQAQRVAHLLALLEQRGIEVT